MMEINNVEMIAMTMPYTKTGMLNPNDLLSYCARVSNPDNQKNFNTSEKLLKYLIDHKHWSPFEMVNVVFEINTTRDIARQILRHRSFSFQEFSQRYAEVNKNNFCIRETRFGDTKNRQNSISIEDYVRQSTVIDGVAASITNENWKTAQQAIIDIVQPIYVEMLKRGVAKEVARAILPEGLTISRMYVNGTLRSWIHYCLVRMDKSTQKEHRIIAEKIWNKLINPFPFLKELKTND